MWSVNAMAGSRQTPLVITARRAYDPPAADDGPRVLVDRLWPRGVSRDRLRIVAWLPDLGPSPGLRKWFGHDPARWDEFRRRYHLELASKTGLLRELRAYARGGRLTLVYGARDPEHNQAVLVREALLELTSVTDAPAAGGAPPKRRSRASRGSARPARARTPGRRSPSRRPPRRSR